MGAGASAGAAAGLFMPRNDEPFGGGGGISGGAMPVAARLPAAVIGAACAQWAEAHGQQLVQSEAQLEEAMREFVKQVGGE